MFIKKRRLQSRATAEHCEKLGLGFFGVRFSWCQATVDLFTITAGNLGAATNRNLGDGPTDGGGGETDGVRYRESTRERERELGRDKMLIGKSEGVFLG